MHEGAFGLRASDSSSIARNAALAFVRVWDGEFRQAQTLALNSCSQCQRNCK